MFSHVNTTFLQDSLGYMKIEKLKEMVGDLGYCDACFSGNYPMEVPGKDISHAFE